MINGNIAVTLINRRDKENVASQKTQLGLAKMSGSYIMWQEWYFTQRRHPAKDEEDQDIARSEWPKFPVYVAYNHNQTHPLSFKSSYDSALTILF